MSNAIDNSSNLTFSLEAKSPHYSREEYKANLLRDLDAYSMLFHVDLSQIKQTIEMSSMSQMSSKAPCQWTIRSDNSQHKIRIHADERGNIRSFQVVTQSDGEKPGVLKGMVNAVGSAARAAFEAIAFLASLPFKALAAVVSLTAELVRAAVVTAVAIPIFLASALIVAPAVVALSIATTAVALPLIGVGLVLASPVVIPVVILGTML